MNQFKNVIDNCELVSIGEAKLLKSLVIIYHICPSNGETESECPKWANII